MTKVHGASGKPRPYLAALRKVMIFASSSLQLLSSLHCAKWLTYQSDSRQIRIRAHGTGSYFQLLASYCHLMPPFQHVTPLVYVRAISAREHRICGLLPAQCGMIQASRTYWKLLKQTRHVRLPLQKMTRESKGLQDQPRPSVFAQPSSEKCQESAPSQLHVKYAGNSNKPTTTPPKKDDRKGPRLQPLCKDPQAMRIVRPRSNGLPEPELFQPSAEHARKFVFQSSRTRRKLENRYAERLQKRLAASQESSRRPRLSNSVRSTSVRVQDLKMPLKRPTNQAVAPTSSLEYRDSRPLEDDHHRQRFPDPQEIRHQTQPRQSGRPRFGVLPEKPLPLPTNLSGYFSWQVWDGRPFKAIQLWAYHHSRHFYVEKRTMKLSHSYRRRAEKRANFHFWHHYYNRTQTVNKNLQGFQLFLIENKAVRLLLRTAPNRMYLRLASTVGRLDTIAHDFDRLLNELHELQRLRMDQIPLKYPPLEPRLEITPHALEQIKSTCNACPLLWTVESISVSLALAAHRLLGRLGSLSKIVDTLRKWLPWDQTFRIHMLQRTMYHNIWELSELGHELKALRYYRFRRYPASSSTTPITVGKQLWQKLCSLQKDETAKTETTTPTRPWKSIAIGKTSTDLSSVGSKLKTNPQGLFNWDRWRGHNWDVEDLPMYSSSPSTLAVASAKAQYHVVAMRTGTDVPCRFRDYLISYYGSFERANESMLSYVRLWTNLNIIVFLLRTAPSHISKRLDRNLEALGIGSIEMDSDLEGLRTLRTTLACLPSSPLLFQSLAHRYAAEKDVIQTRDSQRLQLKSLRIGYKAASGHQWVLHRADYLQEYKKLRRLLFVQHRRSKQWDRGFPCSVAEPAYNAISRVALQCTSVRKNLQDAKVEIFRYSSSLRWRMITGNIAHMIDIGREILLLARYFTAMRYYRAQHFPGSISARVMSLASSPLRTTLTAARNRRAIRRPDQKLLIKPRTKKKTTSVHGDRFGGKTQPQKKHRSLKKDGKKTRPSPEQRPQYTGPGKKRVRTLKNANKNNLKAQKKGINGQDKLQKKARGQKRVNKVGSNAQEERQKKNICIKKGSQLRIRRLIQKRNI